MFFTFHKSFRKSDAVSAQLNLRHDGPPHIWLFRCVQPFRATEDHTLVTNAHVYFYDRIGLLVLVRWPGSTGLLCPLLLTMPTEVHIIAQCTKSM